MNASTTPISIDQYISMFDQDVQGKLELMRSTIQKAVPKAREVISYNIPTFIFNGNLVHFAAFNKHIVFYPGPSGIEAFGEELSEFKRAKGSVQFPLDRPLLLETITKIVKFWVKENLGKGNL